MVSLGIEGTASVIDRCRDAASAIIRSVYLGENHKTKDLGSAIKELLKEETRKNIVISSSDIIRIFHARVKPSEQAKRLLRPVREQDAELAVQCIGTILRELGWADWHG